MESTKTTFAARTLSEGGDAVTILEADHRKIESLLRALPDAAPSERTSLLDKLKTILVLHCATEENLVYPAIHEIAQRPMHAGRLYHQQDDAQVAVWTLSELSTDDPAFPEKAGKLRDAVLAHAHDEETTEFPRLRDAAGDRMADLTVQVQAFRRGFAAAGNG